MWSDVDARTVTGVLDGNDGWRGDVVVLQLEHSAEWKAWTKLSGHLIDQLAFADFIEESGVRLIGVEPAGHGIDSGEHGATLGQGSKGVFFGMHSYLMQDQHGQVEESYSISAGLDFPSVGPQHAHLQAIGRAEYVSITDQEALDAFQELARHEGIIPALESSHALAYGLKMARENPEREQLLIVNLSGRGDKDIFTVADILQKQGAL